ncbi:hypothetical protein BGZ63DRAFT_65183 [Mariannaea sp. PMI_226]|nr:hypothetical protein BGZ63DRAFT_65183 [Mariannaea sp. PMI_226]
MDQQPLDRRGDHLLQLCASLPFPSATEPPSGHLLVLCLALIASRLACFSSSKQANSSSQHQPNHPTRTTSRIIRPHTTFDLSPHIIIHPPPCGLHTPILAPRPRLASSLDSQADPRPLFPPSPKSESDSNPPSTAVALLS